MYEPAVKEWKAEKRRTQSGHSQQELQNFGESLLSPSKPRRKVTRTLPNSSSTEGSQKESIKAGTEASASAEDSCQEVDSSSTDTASLEIAETQQEVFQPVGISVDIPRGDFNREDYDSIRGSQTYEFNGSVPGPASPTRSQVESIVTSLPSGNIKSVARISSSIPTSSSPLRQAVSSDNVLEPETARFRGRSVRARQDNPYASILQESSETSSRLTTRGKTAPQFNTSQPLTRHLLSSQPSSLSGRLLGPEYVPSTLLNSADKQQKIGGIDSAEGHLDATHLATTKDNQLPYFNESQSSPWRFQTQLAFQPHSTVLASHTQDNQLLDGLCSPTRSESSYHSAEEVPAPFPVGVDCSIASSSNSPYHIASPYQQTTQNSFTSADRQDLSNSVFILNSIEADHLLHKDGMDLSGDSVVRMSGVNPTEPAMAASITPQATIYDAALGGSALPIQNSIEEEEPSSNGERFSSDSNQSSSQQSVENERDVAQVAGLVQPTLPILGPNEYALALPCEGKIQSTYSDIIKAKEKSIKKFISRHESIGSANGSPNRTHQRNEMNEMVQRLHDTVTHMDLGLPGLNTQYSIDSHEHAAYANYAGSKFSFLGHLVDTLKTVGLSIIVMCREGPTQDLLEQYLKMKHISVNRQDRMARSKSPAPDRINTDFQVELISTWSTHEVSIYSRPSLMIAFDASFDSQDPQAARIRARFSERPPRLMPVIHLLVANSSEHVDRSLPKSLPSPVRLKALVRYTYRASPFLGGTTRYTRLAPDEPDIRYLDFAEQQRGLRKSPERKLSNLANMVMKAVLAPSFESAWSEDVPQLDLAELEETPPIRHSGITTRAETPRFAAARSRTPLSRAGTPSGRKRLLDIDGVLPALAKRQRLTPLRDSVEARNDVKESDNQLICLQEIVKKLQVDLQMEKEARRTAEQDRDKVKEQLAEWRRDHAGLQRRYEKRMTKCHELDREKDKLVKTIENNKARHQRALDEIVALKEKHAEIQQELAVAREEMKSGGSDLAGLETAREAARTLLAKNTFLEKSLENTRKDFDFTRSQYQNASNQAVELAGQVTELEEDNANLTKQASDEKRRLRELNFHEATNRHLAKITQLELERTSRDKLLRKLEEENRQIKRNRGVQTRGSSVQPPGSPGLDGHGGRTRSRQGSPAPGLFAPNRGSLLRNER